MDMWYCTVHVGFCWGDIGLQRFMFCQIIEIHTSTMLSSYFSLIIYLFCINCHSCLAFFVGLIIPWGLPLLSRLFCSLMVCWVLMLALASHCLITVYLQLGNHIYLHFFKPKLVSHARYLIPSQCHILYSTAYIHVSIGYNVARDNNFFLFIYICVFVFFFYSGDLVLGARGRC